ncbi:isoprenylcysteine alpha-carbonyl methylesterase-like protein [Raphidocelis subcapitata]|uniref:protein-S-isoprenylcysteine alpha-carbonyl methylesterase n=1 Tax=Raphidocelis subcapitata TaxID=307507 RepID=A0A2V0NR79_9CHLO|nr:isoprenylcysteine alpha-carbonyl methylesterase-like protein [Raphidocelis subcapitata]|eukprot:GBF90156.1 isoprenylcysteine alpha-carbonyl methylesterase-like protein [Raphidocelis subcapitata]
MGACADDGGGITAAVTAEGMAVDQERAAECSGAAPLLPPPLPPPPPPRSWHAVDSLADLGLPLSPAAAAEHAVAEAWRLFKLALKLWSYVGLGWKWSLQACRLVVYALLLLPGFAHMLAFYFWSPLVKRDVPYGRKPRQLLDLYVPAGARPGSDPVPVVVFVTGGAWIIGYKAWGAALARRLVEGGALVACLDYRNFPQASAVEMLEDVNTGVSWVSRHAARYGGDPEALLLVGQSAGGQLALMALLSQAAQAASGRAALGGSPCWHPRDVAGFVGVSGAYDLEGLAEHLHRRGLYHNLLDSIMCLDGKKAYDKLSPLAAARGLAAALDGGGGRDGDGARLGGGAGALLPPALLLHGTADKTVPHAGSELMRGALEALGVPCALRLLPGKTHTDLLLEDAFRGGPDPLADAILEAATGRPRSSWHPRTCPAPLVWLAGRVCPF